MGIRKSKTFSALLVCAVVSGTVLPSYKLVYGNDEPPRKPPVSEHCEDVLKGAALTPEAKKAEALNVASKYQSFFAKIRERLLERDYLVELTELALIAREHLLLMGPPGNAKSMLANQVLSNIYETKRAVDGTESQERSYYRIQMTPETTMSETHGPLDYKKLSETGVYDRIYAEGMLLSRNVFIDEIFDARANAIRNILGAINERKHSQGPREIQGRIETVIAATNKYIGEVYEKAEDDGPKALLDRFAFSAFVVGEFDELASDVKLIQGLKSALQPLPKLTFEELEHLRALTHEVEIPDHVAKFLSLLVHKLKGETEALEQASLKEHREKLRTGEDAAPPYRATKYLSPRTIGKAANILRAIIVRDFVVQNGQRKLEATIADIEKLENFFCLAGPADALVETELSRSTNAHEKSQLTAILQERAVFRRNYSQVLGEVNAETYRYALTELQGELDGIHTDAQREAAAKKLLTLLVTIEQKMVKNPRKSETSGEHIGQGMVRDFLDGALREILGARYDEIVSKTVHEIETAKRREQEELRLAQDARQREERRKELDRKLAEQEQHRKAAARKAEVVELAGRYTLGLTSNVRNLGDNAFSQVTIDITPDRKFVTAHGERTASFYSVRTAPEKSASELGPSSLPVGSMLDRAVRGELGEVQAIHAFNGHKIVLRISDLLYAFSLDPQAGEHILLWETNIAAKANYISAENTPDDAVWYLDGNLGRVLKVLPDGTKQYYPITHRGSEPELKTAFQSSDANEAKSLLGMVVAKDGNSVHFFAKNKKAHFVLDLKTETLSLVPNSVVHHDFGGANAAGTHVSTYQQVHNQNRTTLSISVINLSEPSLSRPYVIELSDVGSVEFVRVIGDGSMALVATQKEGLVLVDLLNQEVVAKRVLDSSATVDYVIEIADGEFAYIEKDDARGDTKLLKVVHLRK